MRRTAIAASAALLVATLAAACAPRLPPPAAETPFYQQLGGESGVAAIVEDLLFRIVDDERISHYFVDTDVLRLREKLIEQLCVESGGPCTYTGDSMVDSHAGRGIGSADFDILVAHLLDAMEARKVPVRAQNRLVRRLAPMHADIVERP